MQTRLRTLNTIIVFYSDHWALKSVKLLAGGKKGSFSNSSNVSSEAGIIFEAIREG